MLEQLKIMFMELTDEEIETGLLKNQQNPDKVLRCIVRHFLGIEDIRRKVENENIRRIQCPNS